MQTLHKTVFKGKNVQALRKTVSVLLGGIIALLIIAALMPIAQGII
jgi:uncharacterized protein YaaW (UPF0174 family)